MNEMKPISNFKNKLYQVAVILLLAYAAYSSAMKDLDRLQEVAGNVQAATANGLGSLAKVYSATRSFADGTQLASNTGVTSTKQTPVVDVVDAGGSVALAGIGTDEFANPDASDNSLATRVQSKSACPLRKRELLDTMGKDLKWKVVAQVPKHFEVLDRDRPTAHEVQLASLTRRGPRLRAIISKVPTKSGAARWSNVSEFKSLNDVISFGLKAARTETAEVERHVERVEAADDGSRFVFEFKRGASDSEKDEMEMRQ